MVSVDFEYCCPEQRAAKHLSYSAKTVDLLHFVHKLMTNKTLRWPNRLKAPSTVCVLNQAFIHADHKLRIPNKLSIMEFLVVMEIMCKQINS